MRPGLILSVDTKGMLTHFRFHSTRQTLIPQAVRSRTFLPVVNGTPSRARTNSHDSRSRIL